jgi:transcriptional regulator with XRE-family HTH domain
VSLPERLRDARVAAGLSQGQVAKKLNMHRPTVTEIEAGRRKVSTEELRDFADLYGVSKDWLVDGIDNSESSDARIVLAARELSKMSDSDLDRLLRTLRMLRKPGKK